MIRFNSFLAESLDSAVDFHMTEDTEMPIRIYAAYTLDGIDYGMSLERSTFDKVYILKMYRIVSKKVRLWSFKKPSHVRVGLSTLLKFAEACLPFLKGKIDGIIAPVPKKVASSRFNRLAEMLVRRTYISTFRYVPVTQNDEEDKAYGYNYLFVTRRQVSPHTLFKSKQFKMYDFDPAEGLDADVAEKIEVKKRPKRTVTTEPSKRYMFKGLLAVDAVAVDTPEFEEIMAAEAKKDPSNLSAKDIQQAEKKLEDAKWNFTQVVSDNTKYLFIEALSKRDIDLVAYIEQSYGSSGFKASHDIGYLGKNLYLALKNHYPDFLSYFVKKGVLSKETGGLTNYGELLLNNVAREISKMPLHKTPYAVVMKDAQQGVHKAIESLNDLGAAKIDLEDTIEAAKDNGTNSNAKAIMQDAAARMALAKSELQAELTKNFTKMVASVAIIDEDGFNEVPEYIKKFWDSKSIDQMFKVIESQALKTWETRVPIMECLVDMGYYTKSSFDFYLITNEGIKAYKDAIIEIHKVLEGVEVDAYEDHIIQWKNSNVNKHVNEYASAKVAIKQQKEAAALDVEVATFDPDRLSTDVEGMGIMTFVPGIPVIRESGIDATKKKNYVFKKLGYDKDIKDNIPLATSEIIAEYTGDQYHEFNNPLRQNFAAFLNGNVTSVTANVMYHNLKSKNDKFYEAFKLIKPLPEPIWVYRNGTVPKEYEEDMVPGQLFSDPAFMSTSVDSNLSMGYVNLKMAIYLPKGASVIPILDYSEMDFEKEVILPPFSTIKMLKIAKVPDNGPYSSERLHYGVQGVYVGSGYESFMDLLKQKMNESVSRDRFLSLREAKNNDKGNDRSDKFGGTVDMKTSKEIAKLIKQGKLSPKANLQDKKK